MNLLFSFLLSIFLLFLFTSEAKAIIVIVPVVLIPIVSFVVWIIGALTTPVVALAAFYYKLKKKSPIKGALVGFLFLILLAIIITIVFKLINPQRPIFNNSF